MSVPLNENTWGRSVSLELCWCMITHKHAQVLLNNHSTLETTQEKLCTACFQWVDPVILWPTSAMRLRDHGLYKKGCNFEHSISKTVKKGIQNVEGIYCQPLSEVNTWGRNSYFNMHLMGPFLFLRWKILETTEQPEMFLSTILLMQTVW